MTPDPKPMLISDDEIEKESFELIGRHRFISVRDAFKAGGKFAREKYEEHLKSLEMMQAMIKAVHAVPTQSNLKPDGIYWQGMGLPDIQKLQSYLKLATEALEKYEKATSFGATRNGVQVEYDIGEPARLALAAIREQEKK